MVLDEDGKPADNKQVQSILFQFKPVLSDDWQDMAVVNPTTNPVTKLPFGVLWDISKLTGGKYALRAILNNTSGETDQSPEEIEVWLGRAREGRTLLVGISLNGEQAALSFKHVRDHEYNGIEEPNGEMLAQAFMENGNMLFSKRILDPRLQYIDYKDEETGELRGGKRYVENTAFTLTIPYNDKISYIVLYGVFNGQLKPIGPIQLR